ncbi:PREDICTED: vegetative cell wall protein gp1 [Tarenaya hassleriana]|uniref:vegetative cell wall protein gp1 n=1 Tax=Tarenaya hassleriana TaxID=28532 RepID=UPI00053C579E|nr:PREDICTED: vegetative cell wall protein gp1 [Tarenaya hassleriana]
MASSYKTTSVTCLLMAVASLLMISSTLAARPLSQPSHLTPNFLVFPINPKPGFPSNPTPIPGFPSIPTPIPGFPSIPTPVPGFPSIPSYPFPSFPKPGFPTMPFVFSPPPSTASTKA